MKELEALLGQVVEIMPYLYTGKVNWSIEGKLRKKPNNDTYYVQTIGPEQTYGSFVEFSPKFLNIKVELHLRRMPKIIIHENNTK